MLKKKTKILISVIAFLILTLSNYVEAQNSINSPYSRFGIGNTNIFNNAVNNAMGGVGYTFKRNNTINYMNPASYAGVDTTSLVFDIGFYSEWVNISNNKLSSKGNSSNLSHILLAFPLGHKFKVVAGIMPLSFVNFTAKETIIDTNIGKYNTIYSADGGLNKVALGFAYIPISNLSIGANIEYIFGNYYKASTINFPDSVYMNSSRVENNYHVKGLNINLGMQYFHSLNNGDKLGLGLVYDFTSKYPTDNILSRYSFTTKGGLDYLKDSVLEQNSKNKITYPFIIGGGVSYERENNFFVAIDGRYTNWSAFKLQSDYNNDNLVDNFNLSMGGEWKPDAYGTYFKKTIYRFGLFFDNGSLKWNNNRIKQMGVSCGVGLPIKKTNTLINISLEYFTRGSKDNNLIKEDYFRLGLSFSTKDLWFFQRKYK